MKKRIFTVLLMVFVLVVLVACGDSTKTFKVTFDADGGTPVPAVQNVKENELATKPSTDPTKDGFTFEGWFLGDDEYGFDVEVTEDITLKAKWEEVVVPPVEYTVTFNTDGGNTIANQTVLQGQTITLPNEPTKAGYHFMGWYIGDAKYNPDMQARRNFELKARWEEDYEFEAYIAYVDGGWGYQRWDADGAGDATVVNATVTKDGEYTVSIDFTDLPSGHVVDTAFAALMIEGGEEKLSQKVIVIKDVLLNGEPFTLKGNAYANVEEGNLRVNLFNEWVSEVTEGLTANGSLSGVSAQPFTLEAGTEVESLEITFELKDGIYFYPKAYLQFADTDWEDAQFWMDGNDYLGVEATIPSVNKLNEEYTTKLDFTNTSKGYADGIAFFDVEVLNGEVFYPNSFMDISSVKINGTVVEFDGAIYTSSDDEFATRTNLFNEWVGEIKEGRSADGEKEGITPTPIKVPKGTRIETIEVTFKLVEGQALGTWKLPEEGTTAYFTVANGDWSIYHKLGDEGLIDGAVVDYPVIDGYGQYTAKIDFSGIVGGKVPDVAFLDIEILGGDKYFPWNYMQIDEIKINGVVYDFGETYTSSDNGIDTRTNLFNEWTDVPALARMAEDADPEKVSPTPIDPDDLIDLVTIEVTFTIIPGVPIEEEYEMPDSFHAFMMFADQSGDWEIFDPVEGGGVEVTGDGTYEIILTKAQAGGSVKATGAKVFLVDIEELGKAMMHLGTLNDDDETDVEVTMQVFVDGVEVAVNKTKIAIGDLESKGRLRLELYNEYGPTIDNPAVNPELITPENEIKIIFTLSGTGIPQED